MRWVTSQSSSLQWRFPLGRVRGSVLRLNDWLTLEMVREGYEQKRLDGNAECCLRPAAEKIVIGAAAKKTEFTPLQGQFLAFIYYFAKLNGQPPAEADMERYFKIVDSSVHQMVVSLEQKGLFACHSLLFFELLVLFFFLPLAPPSCLLTVAQAICSARLVP